MTQQEVFDKDLSRINAYFVKQDALISGSDASGEYTLIDPDKVSTDILSAYGNLLSYGYANGLI